MTPPLPTPPTATGRRIERDGVLMLAYRRSLDSPLDSVWAAVTDPDRLARWVGTWSGDPASGAVEFTMLFEGEDPAPSRVTIDECVPSRRLAVRSASDAPGEHAAADEWLFAFDLAQEGERTVLSFTHVLTSPEAALDFGPGWDYYLDRMQLAEAGEDPGSVDFADYHPRLVEHYRAEFGVA
ncbi:SRPBCC domain-containing protein [Rothia sp. AR01]|uniref:SRPBCC domain-containing protein n=1 Tax=Rothia santali TaxID=2949643 RepID=A0A9X2KLM6_9MICC|nr:SRPBCC domain-containing protein [Rothia santali]MCP3426326.1 SRPBCC domain-containing protein [Rothia santali]